MKSVFYFIFKFKVIEVIVKSSTRSF